MRHLDLCGYLDAANAAAKRGDIIAMDRIRNRAFGAGTHQAWIVASLVERLIIETHAEARRPRVEDLRRIAL